MISIIIHIKHKYNKILLKNDKYLLYLYYIDEAYEHSDYEYNYLYSDSDFNSNSDSDYYYDTD